MAITSTQVQQLYIAYFNRPADPAGLAFWLDHAAKGMSLAAIADSFAASAEYRALYADKTSAEVVQAGYRNLFGREPEADGLKFWTARLDSGATQGDDLVLALLNGAQNADAVAVASKTAAAAAFTAALEGTTGDFAGAAGIAQARAWLSKVVDSATLDAARADMLRVVSEGSGMPAATIEGTVSAAGYLSGATVFADANGDGVWNAGEARTVTNARGEFKLEQAKGVLVASGGIDIASSTSFEGVMRAPEGSTAITSLTTLQQALMETGVLTSQAPDLIRIGLARTFSNTVPDATDFRHLDPLGVLLEQPVVLFKAVWQPVAATLQVAHDLMARALRGLAGGEQQLSLGDASATVMRVLASTMRELPAELDVGNVLLVDKILRDCVPELPEAAAREVAQKLENTDYAFALADMLSSACAGGRAAAHLIRGNLLNPEVKLFEGLSELAQNAKFMQAVLAPAVEAAFAAGTPLKLYEEWLGRMNPVAHWLRRQETIGDIDPASQRDDAAIAAAVITGVPRPDPGTVDMPILAGAPMLVKWTSGTINPGDPIVLTFNEPIKLGPGGFLHFQDRLDSAVTPAVTIDLSDPRQFSIEGNNLVLRPLGGFLADRSYKLVGSFGIHDAVADMDGNVPGNAQVRPLGIVFHTGPGTPIDVKAGVGSQSGTLLLSGDGKSGDSTGRVEVHLDTAVQTVDGKAVPAGGPFGSVDASALMRYVSIWGAGGGTLRGTDQDDWLYAGAQGDHVLAGGKGQDWLYGGQQGVTTFLFESTDFGSDRSEAHPPYEDWIRKFGARDVITFEGLALHAVQRSGEHVNISASGVATFDYSISGPLSWADLDELMEVLGSSAAGTAVVVNHKYGVNLIVVGDPTPGFQAGDAYIQITGVSSNGLVFEGGSIAAGSFTPLPGFGM